MYHVDIRRKINTHLVYNPTCKHLKQSMSTHTKQTLKSKQSLNLTFKSIHCKLLTAKSETQIRIKILDKRNPVSQGVTIVSRSPKCCYGVDVRSVARLPYDSLTLLRATRGDPWPIEVKLREMGVCSTRIFEITLQTTD